MKKLFFILALIVGGVCLTACNKDDDYYQQNYEQGIAFLEENAKQEGVVVTKSGLQYRVIKEGDGKKPNRNSTVKCNYEGKLLNGTIFDSSYKRNEPSVFKVSDLIPGWTEGLQLMKEGSTYRLYIPYNLGYGDYNVGGIIPPYSTLIFDVELLEVMQ